MSVPGIASHADTVWVSSRVGGGMHDEPLRAFVWEAMPQGGTRSIHDGGGGVRRIFLG